MLGSNEELSHTTVEPPPKQTPGKNLRTQYHRGFGERSWTQVGDGDDRSKMTKSPGHTLPGSHDINKNLQPNPSHLNRNDGDDGNVVGDHVVKRQPPPSSYSPSANLNEAPVVISNDLRKSVQQQFQHSQYGKWILFGLSIFLIVETSISMIYSMNLKADQELEMNELRDAILILREKLTSLNATASSLLLQQKQYSDKDKLPNIMQQVFLGLDDKIDEKIHNSFLEVNGSKCSAIARNCALDMLSLVPGSIIYSGISKCGRLVGL